MMPGLQEQQGLRIEEQWDAFEMSCWRSYLGEVHGNTKEARGDVWRRAWGDGASGGEAAGRSKRSL